MGKALSVVLRPIKSFNIENRAHRVIGKDKPAAAPHYPSNIQDLQRALESEPDLIEKLSTKNEDLDKRLREVFVNSQGQTEDVFLKQRSNPDRPMPQDRTSLPHFEYGYKEPEHIPYGKTTLRHVIRFLADSQANPKEFTASSIATAYKMKQEDVDTVMRYFKTFEIYLPATKNSPAQYAGPGKVRRQLESEANQLESETKHISDKDGDGKPTR